MPEIPVFDHDAVLAAISPAEAIDRVRDAFVRHYDGEWVMPSKVYLEAPDGPGDFRAMPARGSGLAILKWITSFPGNGAKGLPVVMGAPNVLRGSSHNGNASGRDLVARGLVTALASDYLPSGLLAAAFTLADEVGLPTAVSLVTAVSGCSRTGPVTVTVTPGSTAPDASVTLPKISPV